MKMIKKSNSLSFWALIGLGLIFVFVQGLVFTGYANAQTPRPKPGGSSGDSNGSGHSGGGRSGDSAPLAPKTGLFGFVYNYSTKAYEGGVKVVAQGQGWQAEAVTDSNGYYHMPELGFGKAVVNLRLPADAHPAAPDWPVSLANTGGQQADLGFYWGKNTPPLPLLLTGAISAGQLSLSLKNTTGQAVTGGLVEIITPANLKIAPVIQADQGQLASYAAHWSKFEPGEIAPGQTVALNVTLEAADAASTDPGQAGVQVLFTYKEQLTPLALELVVSGGAAVTTAASTALPQISEISAAQVNSTQPAATSTLAPAAVATATPPATTTVQTTMAATGAASAGQSTTPAPTSTGSVGLLPTTGAEPQPLNLVTLAMALGLILALGIGGWYSVKRQD